MVEICKAFAAGMVEEVSGRWLSATVRIRSRRAAS